MCSDGWEEPSRLTTRPFLFSFHERGRRFCSQLGEQRIQSKLTPSICCSRENVPSSSRHSCSLYLSMYLWLARRVRREPKTLQEPAGKKSCCPRNITNLHLQLLDDGFHIHPWLLQAPRNGWKCNSFFSGRQCPPFGHFPPRGGGRLSNAQLTVCTQDWTVAASIVRCPSGTNRVHDGG